MFTKKAFIKEVNWTLSKVLITSWRRVLHQVYQKILLSFLFCVTHLAPLLEPGQEEVGLSLFLSTDWSPGGRALSKVPDRGPPSCGGYSQVGLSSLLPPLVHTLTAFLTSSSGFERTSGPPFSRAGTVYNKQFWAYIVMNKVL